MSNQKPMTIKRIKAYDDAVWLYKIAQESPSDAREMKHQKEWLLAQAEKTQRFEQALTEIANGTVQKDDAAKIAQYVLDGFKTADENQATTRSTDAPSLLFHGEEYQLITIFYKKDGTPWYVIALDKNQNSVQLHHVENPKPNRPDLSIINLVKALPPDYKQAPHITFDNVYNKTVTRMICQMEWHGFDGVLHHVTYYANPEKHENTGDIFRIYSGIKLNPSNCYAHFESAIVFQTK